MKTLSMELTAMSRRQAIKIFIVFTNKSLHPQQNPPLGGKLGPWQINILDALLNISMPCPTRCSRRQSPAERQELLGFFSRCNRHSAPRGHRDPTLSPAPTTGHRPWPWQQLLQQTAAQREPEASRKRSIGSRGLLNLNRRAEKHTESPQPWA